MAKQYWLMKSEPDVYSYDDLVTEGEGTWDGVRNYSAAIHLRTMKVGDEAFFYHSNIGLEVVGIITISHEYFIDRPMKRPALWPSRSNRSAKSRIPSA